MTPCLEHLMAVSPSTAFLQTLFQSCGRLVYACTHMHVHVMWGHTQCMLCACTCTRSTCTEPV